MNSVNIYDSKLYKKTTEKKHYVYVCLPELGSRVFNRLEKKYYITDKVNCFVISGTLGELKTIDLATLSRKYKLTDGRNVSLDNLKKMAIKLSSGATVIDWFKAQSLPDKIVKWAYFVPSNFIIKVNKANGEEVIVNDSTSEHGYGDFILCPTLAGKANTRDIEVINGLLFPNIYDMRSFKGLVNYITANETPKPPSILKKYK